MAKKDSSVETLVRQDPNERDTTRLGRSVAPEAPRPGSLDRGLAILDFLATERQASIGAIAEAAGASRSATYRLVERLHQAGYLASSPSGAWRLGPAAARLAMSSVQSTDVVQAAPELLRLLAQQTRETVGLGVFSVNEMVFVYRERGPQSVSVNAELGARRPLHCTAVGKAFLAALDEPERRAILDRLQLIQYTEATMTRRADLIRELAEVQRRGWSIERREFDNASACCGAAVLDHTGRPVAAISVAGVADRMERVLDRIGPIVASTAEAISHRLGYITER